MSKRMFIAVGTTAMRAVEKLINSLKECGIYDEQNQGFEDYFVAIDTDSIELGKFAQLGEPRLIHTIEIRASNAQVNTCCPAVQPTRNNMLLATLNSSWTDVVVTPNGVFGERQRSYADLSWTDRMEGILRAFTAGRTETNDDEVIVVATSYGGSSSGLFFNISEFVRKTIPGWMRLYAMVIMPDLGLSDYHCDYRNGWLNFCNFWQQMKQMIWERRLSGRGQSNFVFPFYGGMRRNDFNNGLFPLKTNIDKFLPQEVGCNTVFNRIFPIVPPDPNTRNEAFQTSAVAEMAIFLFYQTFAKSAFGPNRNLKIREMGGLNDDEASFLELNLVSARCSPASLYYQVAIKKFNELGIKFFGRDNNTIEALDSENLTVVGGETDQQIVTALKNCHENINALVPKDVLKGYIEVAERLITKNAKAMPLFDEFVQANGGKITSLPQALKSYESIIAGQRSKAQNVNYLRQRIDAIQDNVADVAAGYQKKLLAAILDKDRKIEQSIKDQAIELLHKTLDEYFEAFTASTRLSLMTNELGNTERREKVLFSDKVTEVTLNGETPSGDGIRFQPYSDSSHDNGANAEFFGRTIDQDISGNLDKYNTDELYQYFAPLFCRMAAEAGNPADRNAPAVAEVNLSLRMDFSHAIRNAAQAIQNWHKEQNAQERPAVTVALAPEQKPYLRKTVKGHSNCLFYIENRGDFAHGGNDSPIDFNITAPKLGEELIANLGLENFKKVRSQDPNTPPLPNAIMNLEPGQRPQNLAQLRQDDCELVATNDRLVARKGNTEYSLKYLDDALVPGGTESVEKVNQTNPNLLGLWVGQISCCMTAAQGFSDTYVDLADPNSPGIVRSRDYMTDESLRSRLLFTLREDLFYGMIFGIINQKANMAFGNAGRITAQAHVRVVLDFKDKGLGQFPIDKDILPAGFALDGKFESVPFEFLTALSGLFRRSGSAPSRFARAFGVEKLEDLIDREEWDVLTYMKMNVPSEISNQLTALREECEKYITVEVQP